MSGVHGLEFTGLSRVELTVNHGQSGCLTSMDDFTCGSLDSCDSCPDFIIVDGIGQCSHVFHTTEIDDEVALCKNAE